MSRGRGALVAASTGATLLGVLEVLRAPYPMSLIDVAALIIGGGLLVVAVGGAVVFARRAQRSP